MAKKGNRLFLWIAAIGLLITVTTVVAAVILLDTGAPTLPTDAQWLHIRLTGSVKDAPGNEGLLVDPADLPPLSTELAAAVRHAALDPEVSGIFLEIGTIVMGWAQVQELRDALAVFRAKEKPCVAWSGAYTNREYYLATACDEILLAPAGLALVNGLALTQLYYKGALDKFGVSANFEHVGDFKSAVEPFQRDGPSEAASMAADAMLDSLYHQFIQGMAEGRGIEPAAAEALIDDPPITPEDAVAAGMIDGLAWRDQAIEDTTGEERTTLNSYMRDRRSDWKRGSKAVAVIYAEGTIVDGDSDQDIFGSGYIGDRTLRQQLADVREDDDVVAVVLRVNSPGGSGSASDAIWRELERTHETKPFVVSMGDYAASGGYYISMGADRIFAEPGTLTGSIGVFGGKLNLAGAYEKLGLTLHTWQRGRYSLLLSGTSDFDEDERNKFRRFLDGFYQTFLSRASQGRGMTVDDVHEVAQGRVWTGEQALERGLVDELGGLDAAIEEARRLAQATDRVAIRRIPERKGFLEQVMDELTRPGDETVGVMAGVPGANEAMGTVARLERVLAGPGVAALMPASIEVH